jgi:hypothetical protein
MTSLIPARGIGSILALAAVAAVVPSVAAAADLVFSCSIHSTIDIADTQDYTFPVRVDPDKKIIRDIDGDGGEGWITDKFSDALIEAHFDLPERIGSVSLDRAAWTIDMVTAFRTPPRSVGAWHGTCVPK